MLSNSAKSSPARRRGRTLALIGPDGVGKSTLAEAVRARHATDAVCIYMGLYQRSGRRVPMSRSVVVLAARRFARWARGQLHRSRGRLVIFDRYSADALLEPERPLGRYARARRWLLAHSCPRPDTLVLLDAPGALLAARLGHADAEAAERQRQRYLALRDRIPGLVVLDATRPVEELCQAVWER